MGPVEQPAGTHSRTSAACSTSRATTLPHPKFRVLIDLISEQLESDDGRYALAPGMQIVAESRLGERSVLEYLLSPAQKVFHEARQER